MIAPLHWKEIEPGECWQAEASLSVGGGYLVERDAGIGGAGRVWFQVRCGSSVTAEIVITSPRPEVSKALKRSLKPTTPVAQQRSKQLKGREDNMRKISPSFARRASLDSRMMTEAQIDRAVRALVGITRECSDPNASRRRPAAVAEWRALVRELQPNQLHRNRGGRACR
jgi:hypothetical protein